jgi:hypothetical protein
MFFIKPLIRINTLRHPPKPNLFCLNFKKPKSDKIKVTVILKLQNESFRLLPI